MIFETRPTVPEMEKVLKDMGLKLRYKPYAEGEPGRWVIMLESRRPARIVGAGLVGTEADIYDRETVRAWTDRVGVAHRLLREGRAKGWARHGEAELFIPAGEADGVLRRLGIRVRREVTAGDRERGRRLAALRAGR